MRIIILLFLCLFIFSCGNNEENKKRDYQSGYGDGYASAYNTACKIRVTLIKGDWENPDYSKGYADGSVIGSADCIAERENR